MPYNCVLLQGSLLLPNKFVVQFSGEGLILKPTNVKVLFNSEQASSTLGYVSEHMDGTKVNGKTVEF